MLYAEYSRLDAYEGQLHLYRLDTCSECVLELSDSCTGYDADALCSLLTDGGVPVEDAIPWAEGFAAWWNSCDVSMLIEGGDDRELRDRLKPFRDVDVCAEITGLRWELG